MSAVAESRVPTIVSIDDAVEACWQLVMDGEAPSFSVAVTKLWPTFRFQPESLQMLAMQGLIQRGAERQRHARQNGSPTISYGAPHGKSWDKYLRVLSTPYKGADATKPIVEFTLTDLAAWAVYNRTMSAAYAKRAEWASKVERLLTEHGAVKVGKLPAAVLSEIASEFAEISEG